MRFSHKIYKEFTSKYWMYIDPKSEEAKKNFYENHKIDYENRKPKDTKDKTIVRYIKKREWSNITKAMKDQLLDNPQVASMINEKQLDKLIKLEPAE